MPKPYGARDRVKLIDREEVARRLDHVTCIALVREAMIALAEGRTRQLLRGIIDLGKGDMFGVCPARWTVLASASKWSAYSPMRRAAARTRA
jgi:ornithine cyclodeaminase